MKGGLGPVDSINSEVWYIWALRIFVECVNNHVHGGQPPTWPAHHLPSSPVFLVNCQSQVPVLLHMRGGQARDLILANQNLPYDFIQRSLNSVGEQSTGCSRAKRWSPDNMV